MKYSALDEYRMSQLLRPYGIRPVAFRVKMRGGRGYTSEDFSEAMERYVPKGEVEARIQELQRQEELWAEAKVEIDKEWS